MLFDILPDNFFSPLASPGKLVYWECLRRLFSVTSSQLSFGVERDVLVEELQYYFDSEMAADIPDTEMDTEGTLGSRDKANFMLRRFEACGWITIDTDHSYVQRVNFADYAITLMKTLVAIEDDRETEYQAYIYTIYSLTKNLRENPGLGLLQIVDNMDQLITGLKSLNANIKRYIDELTKHSTVPEILDALLNDYYSNVVDKAYHRLMTSDNVSKFRPEILTRLESCARSTSFLTKAAKDLAVIREISQDEAQELTLTMIHEVMDAFRSMDEILTEINQKNSRYQRAAISRARFLLSSGDDIRGQLKNILEFMNEQITEKKMDYNATYELEEMDKLVRIFSWEYLDIDSLYAPIEGKKVFVPEEREIQVVDYAMRD
ncbi:MAG: DUF5716 family protein, partial [Eubacteriales bacterium]|nr:DUF5716 family protein [Eubacteriales bacterium]